MADLMSKEDVLARVPQQDPFRFIDEIVELDLEHADFYRGHFPGNPVTPGVILIEAMAQAGVVAYGIYLYAAEHSPGEVDKLLTMFTDAQVDFAGMVKPGDRVTTTARKVFFRRKKLRCEMEMKLDDGTVVCSGVLSGMGVPR